MFTTDLLSCGISLKVETVINYDIPNWNDPVASYIARAGVSTIRKRRGHSHVLVFSILSGPKITHGIPSNDEFTIHRIEQELQIKMQDYERFSGIPIHFRAFVPLQFELLMIVIADFILEKRLKRQRDTYGPPADQ